MIETNSCIQSLKDQTRDHNKMKESSSEIFIYLYTTLLYQPSIGKVRER